MHDLSCSSNTGQGGSSAIRFFSTHQLKVTEIFLALFEYTNMVTLSLLHDWCCRSLILTLLLEH